MDDLQVNRRLWWEENSKGGGGGQRKEFAKKKTHLPDRRWVHGEENVDGEG